MARWEPDAVGRLLDAAMALYQDPGYAEVTVAEIAARAGVTPRTFFRYFADKREVLFYGTDKVAGLVASGVLAAPDGTSALEAVAAGLAAISRFSDEDPVHAEYARKRHAVIQANGELRERELGKHAVLAVAIATALRSRKVTEPAATLAAEAALAAFKVGFERWVADRSRRKLTAHVNDAMRGLGSVISGAVVVGKRR